MTDFLGNVALALARSSLDLTQMTYRDGRMNDHLGPSWTTFTCLSLENRVALA